MSAKSPRPRATLGVTKNNVLGVLARAKIIYAAMVAAVAMFPSPTVAMAAFLALIQALDTAQEATTSRAKGLASARDAKRDAVWTAMEILRAYVQGLSDALTPNNGVALIEAAGLLVAGSPAYAKAVLQAKLTPTPGTVHLVANASILIGGKRSKSVTFHWQWSSDNGKTWNDAGSTPLADTLVPNLTLMTQYQFRVAATVSRSTGAWSQPVGLVVH